jgi:hypothetical protein
MNAIPNIERRESGQASMDRTSEHFGDTEAQRNEREIRDGFAMSAGKADANALCTWAPMVTDWDAAKRMPIDQRTAQHLPKRAQTLTEIMAESLDYSDGPTMVEAMQLILNATRSTDADLAQQAANLVDRMGAAFARMNS